MVLILQGYDVVVRAVLDNALAVIAHRVGASLRQGKVDPTDRNNSNVEGSIRGRRRQWAPEDEAEIERLCHVSGG